MRKCFLRAMVFTVGMGMLLALPMIAAAQSSDPGVKDHPLQLEILTVPGDVVNRIPYPPGETLVNGLGYSESENVLWVTGLSTATIYKVEPSNGNVLSSFPAPGGVLPSDNTWDGASVWHNDFGTNTFYQLNPVTGAVLSSCTPPGPAGGTEGAAYSGSSFFVGNAFDGMIYEIGANCNVLNSFPSPGNAGGADGLGFDHDPVLWVLGYDSLLYSG